MQLLFSGQVKGGNGCCCTVAAQWLAACTDGMPTTGMKIIQGNPHHNYYTLSHCGLQLQEVPPPPPWYAGII